MMRLALLNINVLSVFVIKIANRTLIHNIRSFGGNFGDLIHSSSTPGIEIGALALKTTEVFDSTKYINRLNLLHKTRDMFLSTHQKRYHGLKMFSFINFFLITAVLTKKVGW